MIERTGNDLVVIAANPQELVEAQNATIEQVKMKLAETTEDIEHGEQLIAQCAEASINSDSAKRLLSRAKSRKLFLEKTIEALTAGYVVMPNMPARTIAVRVKREKPIDKVSESTYRAPDAPVVQAEILAPGDGRYVSTEPFVERYAERETRDGKEVTVHGVYPTLYDDEIGLPIEFMKPTVVQMCGKMFARKIFDEVAIVENQVSNDVDPIVIGRILDRRNNKTITFLVAWFLDTKDI